MNTPAAMPRQIKKASDVPVAITKPEDSEPVGTLDRTSPRTKTSVAIVYQTDSHAHVVIDGKELSCPIDEVDIELNADGSGRVILGILADKITVKQASRKPRRRR